MSKGSESAFPRLTAIKYGMIEHPIISDGGLTKREYFAAMVMQGMCSIHPIDTNPSHMAITASLAIQHADALLAELEKTKDMSRE